ncbi:hypothetical protein CONCODRAFT_78396, partial [Conidiobolus coronatus NRRL 28638]
MENNSLVKKLVTILDAIIGKKLSKSNKILFGIDLYWLIIGKRLSLLIDHYYLTQQEFSNLIRKLKTLNSNLIGLSLNDDFNFILISEYFEELKNFKDLRIIDCSPSLKSSELIKNESDIVSNFKEEFSKLVKSSEESKDLILPFEEIQQAFVVSITGYLLNYPVIYYNDNTGDSNYLDNCLNGVDLNVYKFIAKLWSSEYLITSFSIPNSLETDNLSQAIEKWKLNLENFDLNLKLDEGKGWNFLLIRKLSNWIKFVY